MKRVDVLSENDDFEVSLEIPDRLVSRVAVRTPRPLLYLGEIPDAAMADATINKDIFKLKSHQSRDKSLHVGKGTVWPSALAVACKSPT